MTGPMPVEMTFAITGLPAADGAEHAPLIRELATTIETTGPSAVAAGEGAPARHLVEYVGEALLQRLDHPRADLLWAVVADWDDARVVSLERLAEIVAADLVRASATASAAFAMLAAFLAEGGSGPSVADYGTGRLTDRLCPDSGSREQRASCDRLARLAIEESLAAVRDAAPVEVSGRSVRATGRSGCVSNPRSGPLA